MNFKELIFIPKLSCIYKITNKINSKFYIGSAVNLYNRIKLHKNNLQNNKHHSKYLQNSFNKHGIDNFIIDIIEIVDKDNLIYREQYWLDKESPHYNICKIAHSKLYIKLSDETKLKMKISSTGKKASEETKNKIRISKSGKYTILGKRIKLINKFDMNNNFIKSYISIMQASRENNIKRTAISNCANNLTKSAGNYIWRFND